MDELSARGRTALTLGILAALLLGGLWFGWSQITRPYPSPLESAPCSTQVVQAGQSITPDRVTISVLNGSGRTGLARQSMDDLAAHGCAEGDLGTVSADTAIAPVVIWAAADDPAAQLVASYLRGSSELIDQSSWYPGITIVLGEEFAGVTEGLESVTAEADTEVCMPY
jgi:hypothetical protein